MRVGFFGGVCGRAGMARSNRTWLLATTAVLMICSAVEAPAQTAPVAGNEPAGAGQAIAKRAFNIPAQPLSSAVSTFGRQSGLQVTLSATEAGTVRTNAVIGSFTPAEALSRMLSGTGVKGVVSGQSAIIGTTAAATGASGDAPAGSTVLDTITVTAKTGRDASGAGYQGTPDWVYETPGSVSVVSREAIQNAPSRNTRDLLDKVAGVYTNRSEGQNPGIAVNVRGLQDQNRVTTSIDGARQNFQRSGHGATQRTYVDTAFLRAIEVDKGGVSGVGGAGSLGGIVNFRTIEADDLIAPGKKWGTELNATTGTNAFYFDGSLATAVRPSDSFAVLAGVSRKRIGAYEIGKTGTVTYNPLYNSNEALLFSGQDVVSTIVKAEAEPTDDAKLTIVWLRNATTSNQGYYSTDGVLTDNSQDVVNNTFTASLDWDPDSELIDLKAKLWVNDLANGEKRSATSGIPVPVDYGMRSFGGSIENTSRIKTAIGDFSLNYGAEVFRDIGATTTENMIGTDGIDYSLGFRGTNPSGRRDMASAFTNATFERDWLTASAGLRYDYYGLNGSTTIYSVVNQSTTSCIRWRGATCLRYGTTTVTTYPSADVAANMSGGALLPSASVALNPTDWLQPFVKFSKTYRPPSVMEALVAGGHPYVTPLENAPNPWLKPERGTTWEIGVNVKKDGVFSDADTLRVKATAFKRDIEDYITLGKVYRAETAREYASYVNLDGMTRMRGVEVEANYDAGSYYIGGSFTWLDTDWAKTYSYNGVATNAAPSVLFVPPKTTFTLDAGVRLLEKKLTLGGRVTYVGPSSPAYGQLVSGYVTEKYTVIDLYGAYAFNDRTTLRAGVTNLMDIAYVPALGSTDLPAAGRTVTVSLNVKF